MESLDNFLAFLFIIIGLSFLLDKNVGWKMVVISLLIFITLPLPLILLFSGHYIAAIACWIISAIVVDLVDTFTTVLD